MSGGEWGEVGAPRAYLFPYSCSGPIGVDPTCPQPSSSISTSMSIIISISISISTFARGNLCQPVAFKQGPAWLAPAQLPFICIYVYIYIYIIIIMIIIMITIMNSTTTNNQQPN